MTVAPHLRAVLVDDEPLARLELRRLLAAHPTVAVTGEAATLAEARTLLARGGYDLVFLDVQLRGGTGFEALDSIAADAHVVFVTAYDRYAVRAFDINALDYLLKPVTAARLSATLGRLGAAAANPPGAAPAAPPAARINADDRVFVKTGTSLRFVTVSTIAAIRSCENYTELHLVGGEKVMVLRSLKSWEESLPAESFLRVHRQALVNLAHVRRLVRAEGDEVRCELTPPLPPIAASRRQVADLRQRFAAAGVEAP